MVEKSSNITFHAPTYTYPQLFSHLKAAKLSLWTNKWTDVYDFTPGFSAESGKPNYKVSNKIISNFVSQFDEIHSLVKRVSKKKGNEITNLEDISENDVA